VDGLSGRWLEVFRCNVVLVLNPVSKESKIKEANLLYYVLVSDSYVHKLMLREYIRDVCSSPNNNVIIIYQ
jgi:hypothetical protein